MKTLLAALLSLALPGSGLAADRPEGIGEAEALARAALVADCDMNGMQDVPMARPNDDGFGHSVYRLSYTPDYDPGGAPVEVVLYQLFCGSGAYNIRHAFVLKRSDEETLKLVAFAAPDIDYAYADEEMTRLKADPTVRGFTAAGFLVNATYDEATRTIASRAAWRGLGDAWDGGQWVFRNGNFLLTRFEVDPTYGEQDPAAAESYVVYEAGK